jgi:lambda repressor-like predicted transcriptional regulator
MDLPTESCSHATKESLMPKASHPITLAANARGRTIADLAVELGYSPETLRVAMYQPWPAFRRNVAEALCMPERELFGDDPAAQLVAQRVAQGFGPTVTNAATLRAVARVLVSAADGLERAG